MGNFDNSKLDPITPKPLRGKLRDPLGLFEKPKAPKPTQQEKELEARQRKALDDLTRETNSRLKSIKRGRAGRQTLLGGGGSRGVRPGGGGPRNRGGGAGGATRPGPGTGQAGGPSGPARSGILGAGRRR